MSSLALGLASAASVSYIMFVITRTLTGLALAGFTIIVLPLGEADRHGQGPEEGHRVRWAHQAPANCLPFSRVRVAGCGTPRCGWGHQHHLLDRRGTAAGPGRVPDSELAVASAGCLPALCPRHRQHLVRPGSSWEWEIHTAKVRLESKIQDRGLERALSCWHTLLFWRTVSGGM